MTTRIHTLVRTLALAVLAACFFVPTARAQFGLAFTYGDFTEIGGQISLYRPLGIEAAPGLRLGGDIAGYIPQSTEFAGTDISDTYFIESNVNAQYAFLEQGGGEVYGFGGFHYGYSVTTFESDGFDTVTGGDAGVNLGVGGKYGRSVGLFGELKITLGGFDQFGVVTGVRF